MTKILFPFVIAVLLGLSAAVVAQDKPPEASPATSGTAAPAPAAAPAPQAAPGWPGREDRGGQGRWRR